MGQGCHRLAPVLLLREDMRDDHSSHQAAQNQEAENPLGFAVGPRNVCNGRAKRWGRGGTFHLGVTEPHWVWNILQD